MADASIVIDTKLDNRGFQSGSNQMKNAVNSLQSAVDGFGRQAQESFNAMVPALQSAAEKAQALSTSLTETNFQRNVDQMSSACEKLDQKILSLKQRAEQGFRTEAEAEKWQSDLQKLQQEAANLQQKMAELGAQTVKADSLAEMETEAQKLEQQLFKLYDKRDAMQDMGADTASKAWQNLEYQIKNTEEALDRVERGIAAKSDPGSIESEVGGKGYTQGNENADFQQLAQNVNSATVSLNSLSGATAEFKQNSQEAGSSASSFGSIIASPSKVFEKIGSFTMEGMEIGLEKTGEDAIDSVANIADAMVKEAQNGNGIAIRIDAMTDGLVGVESSLARIADIFIGITDSLTEMGGLTVPAIAAGQVIPYGAAANATESPENSINGEVIRDAILDALSRSQNGSTDDPVSIKLQVDGRTIADVVTKYQRQQARAWG